jgi:hypothetical protein
MSAYHGAQFDFIPPSSSRDRLDLDVNIVHHDLHHQAAQDDTKRTDLQAASSVVDASVHSQEMNKIETLEAEIQSKINDVKKLEKRLQKSSPIRGRKRKGNVQDARVIQEDDTNEMEMGTQGAGGHWQKSEAM